MTAAQASFSHERHSTDSLRVGSLYGLNLEACNPRHHCPLIKIFQNVLACMVGLPGFMDGQTGPKVHLTQEPNYLVRLTCCALS
jgi:hypothetical protein